MKKELYYLNKINIIGICLDYRSLLTHVCFRVLFLNYDKPHEDSDNEVEEGESILTIDYIVNIFTAS
jgi:hypothetical protein